MDAPVYVQRAVRVRAVRWFPPGHPSHVASDVVELHGSDYKIGTANGWRTIHPGDYIVYGHNNSVYPARPEVFEAAYERECQCLRTHNDSAGS